ncbi:hypothetical protein [Bacillus atrophaeus]|uniref:hypothetical protein n=1 Tax=Bacillus atrophaeus TaxID=1452 RepID=UPI0022812038|nr:hypothetical protein [Bacillus atrophaeus]MCY8467318.1 hypothetical protein [Bacillus atrophaeus]MCY8479938.1 hypothetical protein [Bacillus atrophaeus]
MFKSKIKKIVGAVAFTGILLVSGSPAVNAETLPGLIWVRDKFPNAYDFGYYKKDGQDYVDVYIRLWNGKTDVKTVKCEVMYQDRCFVKE